jgi:hypothetical protein
MFASGGRKEEEESVQESWPAALDTDAEAERPAFDMAVAGVGRRSMKPNVGRRNKRPGGGAARPAFD